MNKYNVNYGYSLNENCCVQKINPKYKIPTLNKKGKIKLYTGKTYKNK